MIVLKNAKMRAFAVTFAFGVFLEALAWMLYAACF